MKQEQPYAATALKVVTELTPDGAFHIIIDDNGIAHASGYGDIDELVNRLPADLRQGGYEVVTDHPYQKIIKAYYAGDMLALEAIRCDQTGTEFQKRVWSAISSIPAGKTMSYKELASASGNSAAVRAAGTICGLNRLILLVPCHRVLKSNGSIGSYLYGPAIKQSLLLHEGAILEQEKKI